MEFSFSFELRLDTRKEWDVWSCTYQTDMEFSDRPRVGEQWKFYTKDGIDMFEDYNKITNVWVHHRPGGKTWVHVDLEFIELIVKDFSMITQYAKEPGWSIQLQKRL